MAQWFAAKAQHPDALVFFRMGDFYELFFGDAEAAAAALDIALTQRGEHGGQPIRMCGVPVHAADAYLLRLIRRGFRVAVAEQMEDPKARVGKAPIRREVVRLVTPGTLTEDALLEAGRPNLLLALAQLGAELGAAWIDVSTGAFETQSLYAADLPGLLARLDAVEILAPAAIALGEWERRRAPGAASAPPAQARRRVAEAFGAASLDAFGSFSDAEAAAALLALDYVRASQAGKLPHLLRPLPQGSAGRMELDAATRASLDIARARDGGAAHTLLAAVQRTVTAAGARLLAEWLAGPLTDPDAIAMRQDGWSLLRANTDLATHLRAILRAAPDMARALARLSLNRGGPRDLAALRDGLAAASACAKALDGPLPRFLADARDALDPAPALAAVLASALADPAPLRLEDGALAAGFDGMLDGERALRDDSRRVIASMQLDFAQKYRVASLKIRHHAQLGYVIEAPAAAVEALRQHAELTLRQGMANGARFTCPELSDLDRRIREAAERAASRERVVFGELCGRALAHADAIARCAAALASLDVAQSAAKLAEGGQWCRPVVSDDAAFQVEAGRHPVVEAALSGVAAFVANDCTLPPDRRVLLLTGPNMAGKSTFLRQNALIAILAQAGLPAPAAAVRLGVVDRLFSRVGAADDLARGRSTFMVEMTETAAILHQAGPRSLVIVDEIGRGTATLDGLAIAWAVLEALHNAVRCRVLFATHFHELAQLTAELPRLSPHTMRVKEWKHDVVFLHEVAPGAGGRSWGVHVAKLAGVPNPVVKRAASLLTALETRAGRLTDAAALPLFACAAPEAAPTQADPLREALAALDPDRLAPRAALEELYRLKALSVVATEATLANIRMMSPPPSPQDAAALLRQSLDAAAPGLPPRDVALAVFRRHLALVQSHVRDAFDEGSLPGLRAARLLASYTDGLLTALHGYALALHGGADAPDLAHFTVAATGGYGRGVLAPFSDIDLLFLTRAEPTPTALRVVEFTLYFLWDLGLKVGHATRTVDDCLREANGDATVRTSMLDARRVTGDAALFDDFAARFRAACQEAGPAGYIAAKRAERDARHRRYGDSPFVVEPNIKEGRGGLRDLQTLYWMARYVFGIANIHELARSKGAAAGIITEDEARLAQRSWAFLWSLRFHLHYVTGRAEERLTFDLQPVVGARMGYTRHGRQDGVERFMRHYFLTAREVSRLTHVMEPALIRAALGPPAIAAQTDQALRDAGFVLADGKLLCANREEIRNRPIMMLAILQVARDRGLELHPLGMRALIRNERRAVQLRGDPAAATLFMNLLCGSDADRHRADGARWLQVMNESGLLGRYLPDWARIVGQMQFDTYHIFTVDEHTIEAVRVLNLLERRELAQIAPVATELMDQLQSRRALYAAMLLHDICKGRGGDHSELGAELALQVGPGLGLTGEETETVSWLVLHHLLLSQTAFKRDIDDPKTILDLADTIQSPERLRLLHVLTVADMRAVSPKVWNGWKATLLRELFARVAEVLEGGLATTERDVRVQRAKASIASLLDDWPPADVERFLALGYAGYWLSFDPETHLRHARLIRDADGRGAPLTVETQPLPARAVTEVTVYAADHAGLFSRIAGALAVAGASIVDARIHTLTNGSALDTFWIQDAAGGAFDQPHRLARLYVLVEQALSGRIRLASEIRKVSRALLGRRMRAIHVPPRVVIDNRASNTHTVLEVNGRDRPGLLHDVTAAISEQGLQIASAHVTTYGVRAVDVFYVKDVFGLKVENERKLALLREALLLALASPDEAAPTPAPEAAKRRAANAA